MGFWQLVTTIAVAGAALALPASAAAQLGPAVR